MRALWMLCLLGAGACATPPPVAATVAQQAMEDDGSGGGCDPDSDCSGGPTDDGSGGYDFTFGDTGGYDDPNPLDDPEVPITDDTGGDCDGLFFQPRMRQCVDSWALSYDNCQKIQGPIQRAQCEQRAKSVLYECYCVVSRRSCMTEWCGIPMV